LPFGPTIPRDPSRGPQPNASLPRNLRLLEASRNDAVTDPLTGLGNRRAFKSYLKQILPSVNADDELMVVMFDLDGFKQYNDTFGHGAGDALLARFAQRLRDTAGSATAYRMGGDEFCVLARGSISEGEQLIDAVVGALSDAGEAWRVDARGGVLDALGSDRSERRAEARRRAHVCPENHKAGVNRSIILRDLAALWCAAGLGGVRPASRSAGRR
jgi:GGDEF domain-containing protein